MLPLTFSNVLDSNNPSIHWSLRFLLPKASAPALHCFKICKKFVRQLKILAILYYYPFIIILNLTLQQVVLFIELNEVRNICQQMSGFSISFVFPNIWQKFVMEKHIRPSSSALSILYFSTNWKHSITYFIVLIKA